ncbi:MFS transporter [bacterium]|nr:MFS transporter [bacterium]
MAYTALFRNGNFLKLWGAQVASQLAANLLNFALIIRVFDLAAGTWYQNISVSLLITAFGVPSIVFAAFAGAMIDHLDRKKVLVATNLVRAVLVLLFLVLDTQIVWVYLTIFAISTFTQFFVPAEAAALPSVTDHDHLVAANSLFVFTLYGSFMVGYSLAGPVVKLFGPYGAYWVTSGAFLLAGLLSLGLPTMRATDKTRPKLRKLLNQVTRQVGRNIHLTLRKREYAFPIMQLTIAQAIVGVVIVLAPALSQVILGKNLSDTSHILVIPAGVGMVLGAIAVGQFLRKADKYRLIKIGVVLGGLMLVALGLVRQVVAPVSLVILAAAVVFILGLVNALVSVSAQTLLQINTTDDIRGKVFGSLNMMVNIAAVLPVLLAGITADLVSPTTVVLVVGVIILIYGVFMKHPVITDQEKA